ELNNSIETTNEQTDVIISSSKRSGLEESLHLDVVEPKTVPSNTKQAIANQSVAITASVASDPTENFTSSEVILLLDYREIKKKDHKYVSLNLQLVDNSTDICTKG